MARTVGSYIGHLGATCALAALAACGQPLAEKNPQAFGVKIRDGVITGVYDPKVFSSAAVHDLVAENCPGGKLGLYTEVLQEGNLIAIETECAA